MTSLEYCRAPIDTHHYFMSPVHHPDSAAVRSVSGHSIPGKGPTVGIELLGTQQPEFQNLVERCRKGLLCHPPQLCSEGLGGTYFLYDEAGRCAAVFKPADEEAFAVNNPKNPSRSPSAGAQSKKGVMVGEAANKECAAYMLDRKHFAGVPRTCFVRCTHWAFHSTEEYNGSDSYSRYNDNEDNNSPKLKSKLGSLQRFVSHECASWDLGPSMFPVSEVHKIGVLDIRLLNLDRHGGNILVKKLHDGHIKLVPIDHGYCLPNIIDCDDLYFEWLHWPQAKVPFSDDLKQYIMDINVEDDLQTLKMCGIKKESREVYQIMTTLLKKGLEANLTLYELGLFICRPDLDSPSRLERVYQMAKKHSMRRKSKFLGCISRLLDDSIQDYVRHKQ